MDELFVNGKVTSLLLGTTECLKSLRRRLGVDGRGNVGLDLRPVGTSTPSSPVKPGPKGRTLLTRDLGVVVKVQKEGPLGTVEKKETSERGDQKTGCPGLV